MNRILSAHCTTASLAVLFMFAAACSSGGDPVDTGGAGGAGGGGASGPGSGAGSAAGPGGGASSCVEMVDSAVVGSGIADTPHITAIDGGYAITSIRGGEVWLDIVDENISPISSKQISNAGATDARLPSVHAAGGGLVCMWAEASKVLSRPATMGGVPQGQPAVVATTTSAEPRPMGAALGDQLGAAWMQANTSSMAAVLAGGSVTQSSPVNGWFPAVATRDGEMGVSWSSGSKQGPVSVATYASIGSPVTVTGSKSLIKDMTAGEGSFYVTWEDVNAGAGAEQVRVAKITDEVAATVDASPAGSSANWPAVVWTGDRVAVAYYQFRDGPATVYLGFFDADLQPLEEMELAAAAKYPSATMGDGVIAVAYNASNGPLQVSLVSCP